MLTMQAALAAFKEIYALQVNSLREEDLLDDTADKLADARAVAYKALVAAGEIETPENKFNANFRLLQADVDQSYYLELYYTGNTRHRITVARHVPAMYAVQIEKRLRALQGTLSALEQARKAVADAMRCDCGEGVDLHKKIGNECGGCLVSGSKCQYFSQTNRKDT